MKAHSLKEFNMSAENLNRIGIVSSIDYEKGMVLVTYPDRDNSTTKLFPYLCPSGDYSMPKVGDSVMVVHLSNNSASGVVLGTFWDFENKPLNPGKAVHRKQLSSEAYIECVDDEITCHDKNGTVTLKDIITALGGLNGD